MFLQRLVHGTTDLPVGLFGRATREAHMKLTIPGILITALIVASPTAFAQQRMDYKGTSSNPATSVSKDETTDMTKSKKMANPKKKGSKAQTTGSGTKY